MKIQEIADLIGIEISTMPDEKTWDLLDRHPDKKTMTEDGREIITKRGKPYSHIANINTVLETDPHYADVFSYNILKRRSHHIRRRLRRASHYESLPIYAKRFTKCALVKTL